MLRRQYTSVIQISDSLSDVINLNLFFFFFFFGLFRAALVAYGGSQARDQIGVVAASLCHSHSSAGAEPGL